LDHFLFHNEQYMLLDAVREKPWIGVPLPFAECIFELVDTGLQVSTAVCHSGNQLSMAFSQATSSGVRSFCSADIALLNWRWPDTIRVAYLSGQNVPPDCMYEFIRFYQRLSIYLAQPKSNSKIFSTEVFPHSPLMVLERPGMTAGDAAPQKDRIISLEPLSEIDLYRYKQDIPPERKPQEHPCTYSFWVRGHQRRMSNGLCTWVEPHRRNIKFPDKSKTYTLAQGGMSHADHPN